MLHTYVHTYRLLVDILQVSELPTLRYKYARPPFIQACCIGTNRIIFTKLTKLGYNTGTGKAVQSRKKVREPPKIRIMHSWQPSV